MRTKVNPKVPAASLGGAAAAIFCYYLSVPPELTWAFTALFSFAFGWATPDK